ncbi:hypothetical protein CPB83DRAFT_398651 [Crepidotus variabilis]|uniref:Uncharacterized protein n=1 Tax=Crepidotus variabilis TaxID=179855 RepID=A0A9P6JNK7_9AGAR|nr:hypothetical protein CPB83DRAFT_398651 [Crepidotus variabilis]
MSFTAGISINSLTTGSTIKAKVLSHEDDNYSQTFEIRIDENLQSAFRYLEKIFSEKCGEVKYVAIAIPTYFKEQDREFVNTTGKNVFSHIRTLKNLHLVHSNSLQVDEHPPENHIAVEIGQDGAAGRVGVVEAEDKIMFYGDTEDVYVHDMDAIEPDVLFNRTMQPFLDRLSKNPTECGSEVHKVVVLDSSPIENHPTMGFRLHTLAQTRIRRSELPTEFVYEDGSKILDHIAKTSCKLYEDSLQPLGCIFNVMCFNVSIAKVDGFVKTILRRHQTIPTQGQAVFTTAKDNQTEVHLHIMVGLAHRVADNKLSGKLVLRGLPPKSRGEVLIRVSIMVDYYEQMTVVAEEVGLDLIPVTNGASATIEFMTTSGEANLDARLIDQLFVDFRKLDVEEDLRQSQEVEQRWADSSASVRSV